MALSAAKNRRYNADVPPIFAEHVVKSGVQIHAGGAVAIELATGLAYIPVGTDTAEVFVGFADESVLGDGSKRVRVRSQGVVEVAVTGVNSGDDVKKPVYMVDDDSFSLTNSGNDLACGRVFQHDSGTLCRVAFSADALRGADLP